MKEAKLRPIPGFPDYFVNDLGEIWSQKWGKLKKLKPIKIGDYLYVYLYHNNKRSRPVISRLVLNAPKNKQVDHIDCNPLNNHISNLRLCSCRENKRNGKSYNNSSSRFKGVSWHKEKQKWQVRIVYNYRIINLGCFENEKDAAKAYNEKAKELFGEFARLNEI